MLPIKIGLSVANEFIVEWIIDGQKVAIVDNDEKPSASGKSFEILKLRSRRDNLILTIS